MTPAYTCKACCIVLGTAFTHGQSLLASNMRELAGPDHTCLLAGTALAAAAGDPHFTDEHVSFGDAILADLNTELRAQVGHGGGGSPHDKGGRGKGEGGFLIDDSV